MKIRNILDNLKKPFEKGQKLEKLYPAFDAFETFLFVPNHTSKTGAHIRDAIDLKRVMITVIIALLPALFYGIYNTGYQYLVQLPESFTTVDAIIHGSYKIIPMIAVSYIVGLSIEFLFAILRGHQVNEGYLVTGLLIPMIMPVDIPLWMVGVSGETILGMLAAGNSPGQYSVMEMCVGSIPGSIAETSTLMVLIGAIILIYTGIGSWRIMLGGIIGAAITGILFNLWGANALMSFNWMNHLIVGGFAFGIVFMATDPVSAAQTVKGKWIYGILVGILCILIRVFNPAYPEGVMLAILLMNVFAPTIDHYVIESNVKKREKRLINQLKTA